MRTNSLHRIQSHTSVHLILWLRFIVIGIGMTQFLRFQFCDGFPTLVVKSPTSKCLYLEASEETAIVIFYDAPDIPLDRNHPNYGPTYLTVNVQPAESLVQIIKHVEDNHKHGYIDRLTKPINQHLTARSGNITHAFATDGIATICIRSFAASAEHPQRLGLRMVREMDLQLSNGAEEDTPDISLHLSTMKGEVQHIGRVMKQVMAEAEFTKEKDAILHQQTDAMDQATIFWPIVQICVLLMTGFAQTSHIVKFFRSRRIL